MWKATKYLYYKLYKLFLRMHGKNDIPEYTALCGVASLLFFNILAVFSIINVFFPIWNFPEISRGKFFIIVGVPYILILYFTFIFNGKYLRIIKEFEKENEEQRKKGSQIVKFYIISSFFLFLFSLLLIVLNNEGVI